MKVSFMLVSFVQTQTYTILPLGLTLLNIDKLPRFRKRRVEEDTGQANPQTSWLCRRRMHIHILYGLSMSNRRGYSRTSMYVRICMPCVR
ncbi:hypothetical protein K504DRAFT_457895 [Pleomassaria siparia CBS 279.74]|uniref:Uncharacterized protein n=1 Tax=Pleomassaria siparia CBS 279.74 TaxID=1314801 RepID=A0A6G1KSD0_9PLEO|nr:hypothetical protein K504DRAFT_457895 [Pleomassaria siparia CBS 279.74]